jgi:hypothetical protein
MTTVQNQALANPHAQSNLAQAQATVAAANANTSILSSAWTFVQTYWWAFIVLGLVMLVVTRKK